jgi:hypothetical protein
LGSRHDGGHVSLHGLALSALRKVVYRWRVVPATEALPTLPFADMG